MRNGHPANECVAAEHDGYADRPAGELGLSRRRFVQVLGAGLIVTVSGGPGLAQRRRGRGRRGAQTVSARIHIATDGTITVLTDDHDRLETQAEDVVVIRPGRRRRG